MPIDPATLRHYQSVGRDRLEQLRQLHGAPPDSFLEKLANLPWVRFHEVIDHDLDARGGFYPSLLELVVMLEEIATNQRGPGILGFFEHLEFSFSLRTDASYAPRSRVLSLSLGLLLLASELEETYRWLYSVLFGGGPAMAIDRLERIAAPRQVRDEIATIYRSAGGALAVTGKNGLTHPIGQALHRFVLAHETGHLIDFAESPALRASWRDTVWSDYKDALEYSLTVGEIDPSRYARFQRSSLDEETAGHWATEFLADGMGLYTLSQLPPSGGMTPARARAVLQSAVETFFRLLVIASHGDVGTSSHPPPTLRSGVLCARLRKDRRATWTGFLSEHWGTGLATRHLLDKTIATMGAAS